MNKWANQGALSTLHSAATEDGQRTAAPLGSPTVQVMCQRFLQPTGRFRRQFVIRIQ
jgi:hypothetical protein